MSIRNQILIIIFVTVVFVIGIGTISWKKQREFITEELSEYQQLQLSYVTQAAEKVEYSFHKLTDALYALSQIPEVQFLEKNTCLLSMVRVQKLNKKEVDSIYRSDKNGKIRYSFPRTDCPVEGEQLREIFKQCRLTGKSVLQVVRTRKDGSDFLVIAQPVYTVQGEIHLNPSNKFSGLLFFITSLNQLQDHFFSSSLITGRGYPWIITEDELLICTSNRLHHGKRFAEFLPKELQPEKQVEILSILKQMKDGNKGVGRYSYNVHADIRGDFLKLTAFSPVRLPHQTWSIAVSTPLSNVLTPLKQRIGELRFFSVTLIFLLGCMALLSIQLLRRNHSHQLRELQRKEEENRRVRNQWQITFDTVNSIMFLLDKDLNVIRANKVVKAIETLGPKGVVGKNFINILSRFDFEEKNTPYEDIHESNSIYSTKLTYSQYNQLTKIYLMTIVSVEDEAVDDVVFVCSLKDITDIEELQNQYHRAQKMESIGLMAGGVAHDLNNILSGIASYPELLLMMLPKESELRHPVEVIKSSGQRAAAVVDDLLTVARGVASVKTFESVNEVVDVYTNSPEFLKLKSRFPKIVFESKLTEDIAPIQCSAVHVQKCLMNLVVNGAEAIEIKGKVTIRTEHLTYTEDAPARENLSPGKYVVLSVTDTGSGISKHDLERVFEPFYSKKVMGKSGTGLGLAVVWNTMQDHNGMVDVSSSSQGTCFSLYFPAQQKIGEKKKKNEIDKVAIIGHGEKILIVDDQELQREIASKMLLSLGYQVSTVQSGEEAIEFLRNESMDLIVLDMIMDPGISGCETFEQILQFTPNQKAIIASGFSEDIYVKKAMKLGAATLVKKPYSLEQLGTAVRDALGNQRDH